MNCERILLKIAEVYNLCAITSFPIDCFQILENYDYKVFTYDELKCKNNELFEMCFSYSDEALWDGLAKIIAYNDKKTKGRIRFSLMHELGHVLLEHNGENKQHEREANYFASHILAPRVAIHYAHCKNAPEVAHIFDISLEAAEYAFDDYRRWHRLASYKISFPDKKIYTQFYDQQEQKFIYRRTFCSYCSEQLLNTQNSVCARCTLMLKRTNKRKHDFNSTISDSRLYSYLESGL